MMQVANIITKAQVSPVRWAVLLFALALNGAWAVAHAAKEEAISATLRKAAHYSKISSNHDNGFGRPLWLESVTANGTAKGTVEAVLAFPFSEASRHLRRPASWCDILILHFNIKSCSVVSRKDETVIEVGIGRKHDHTSGKVYHVSFMFGVVEHRGDWLHVRLIADKGPLSTRNYRIVVMASPLSNEKLVVKLSYAYDYGLIGKLAMEAYLGTLGRNKVGFTVEGRQADGRPRYVRGMRGAVERNAMRYCLAVESFMRSLSWPRYQQVEARLQDWFTSTQHFSRQLYEMDRDAYLALKRKEIERQQAFSAVDADG
ncbi:MAG: hypothetical protein GTO41_10905 [Burkholderiales bacterium]|nr:hypothetical protein [Burkholderiales bacterium]